MVLIIIKSSSYLFFTKHIPFWNEQALGDEQCCLTNVDPSSNFICKKIDSYIGHGVFALKKFIPGDFLLQYPGCLVTAEKGDKLEKYYEKKGKGCYLYFFNYHGKKLCVDATKNNRLGKFVNDSQKSYANSVMKVKSLFPEKIHRELNTTLINNILMTKDIPISRKSS
ncbi:N-lysine methyltransferase KMT5A-B-like [Hydractinia symbiolongicarpus]|uniref:N-lysine methyltransferase KMT5A-B-like n=1 Tax=Hydractinia symbiolongicarpus TaxID=13093 RepID=UPI00254D4311|nr:N-lysine methyltransferase KMT5A-B-like [Hydractinia symbiolongicarpus]